MSKDTELQRLEQFVEKLLTKFTELKDQKNQLVQELKERDALINELRGNISTKDDERNEISVRVNKLVGQIEEWELALGEEDTETIEGQPVEQDSDHDVVVVDEAGGAAGDDPEAMDVDGDEEARVQHNLFSV